MKTNRLLPLVFSYLFFISVDLAQSQVLFGSKWNGKTEIFNSLTISTKKFKELKPITFFEAVETGQSTFDANNNRYFYKSYLGITVVNAVDGAILETFTNSTILIQIEYDSNKILGTYSDGLGVMLSSLNLTTKKLKDIGYLKGVLYFREIGESTFDALNKRYFIKTNLGITVINALTAEIIDTIKSSIEIHGIEYDRNSNCIIGSYWNGKAVMLVAINIATKKFKDIGILNGVTGSTVGESTFDWLNKIYFIKTNLGITVIDIQNAAIIDTITDSIVFNLIEFSSLFGERAINIKGKCVNDSMFFKLSYIDNIDSARWDFGDPISGKDNFSNGIENVFHIFKTYGNYSVKLIAFYKNLSDTFISNISFEQPKADFTISDVCEGFKGIFTNTSLKLSLEPNYFWKFGDGQASTLKSPQHLYDIAAISQTFNVTLVVKTQSGCADSITNPVTINAKPKSDFDWNLDGGKINLTAKQAGNSYYRWLFNNVDSIIGKSNPAYNFSNGMKVCLKVINAAGCISETCREIWIGKISQSKVPEFKIYPNPNTGNFTVEIENPEKDISIEVYNSVGGLVKRVEKVEKVISIYLDVSVGIYLVKVSNGNTIRYQKVNIQSP